MGCRLNSRVLRTNMDWFQGGSGKAESPASALRPFSVCSAALVAVTSLRACLQSCINLTSVLQTRLLTVFIIAIAVAYTFSARGEGLPATPN